MTKQQKFIKRSFDVVGALCGLVMFGWLIIICWIIATIDTNQNGFFFQTRVGRRAKFFKVIKIRSMKNVKGITTTVTTKNDPRISPIGSFFRKTKLDELPQLFNVLIGKMSFVGPRPDVPGYADKLTGDERRLLDLRPGITGPASLYFRDEEQILASQPHPEKYNDEILWPLKTKINLSYLDRYSLWTDIRIIFITITGIGYQTFKKQIDNNKTPLNAT